MVPDVGDKDNMEANKEPTVEELKLQIKKLEMEKEALTELLQAAKNAELNLMYVIAVERKAKEKGL